MTSLPVPAQVAEIHRASKDGQLYDVGGGAKSCSAQAEPPEPNEYDIPPTSHVYSVSGILVSTPNLGPGKAPLLCPQVGHILLHLLVLQPWPWVPGTSVLLQLCFCRLQPLLPSARLPNGVLCDSHALQSPTPTNALQGTWGLSLPSSSSQLKAKRVGAGFPKDSCPFQTATELMEKSRTQEQVPQPVRGDEREPPSQPCGLQDEGVSEALPGPQGEAPGGSAPCAGPSAEKVKGSSRSSSVTKARASKKQQLLAAAAHKDSQNIARFFCPRAESPPPLAAAPRAGGASPSCGGMQGPLTLPEKCAEEEDGLQGCLTAPPQTEACPSEGPR